MAGLLGDDRRDGGPHHPPAIHNAVYVAPARPLLEVAKQVATAAVISQGRVALTVGAGWMREEFELLGQSFDDRGKRLNEMIPALRELWRGDYYVVPELMLEPHPPTPVPIMCGGESEAALRRAARLCDGWVGTAYAWDDAVPYVARPAPRVRPRRRTLRDHARADGGAQPRPLQAGRGSRRHGRDVRARGWERLRGSRARSSSSADPSNASPRRSSRKCADPLRQSSRRHAFGLFRALPGVESVGHVNILSTHRDDDRRARNSQRSSGQGSLARSAEVQIEWVGNAIAGLWRRWLPWRA